MAEPAKVVPLSTEEKAAVERATMTTLPGVAGLSKYELQHDDQGVTITAPGRPPAIVQIDSPIWRKVQSSLPERVPVVINMAPNAPGTVLDTLFDAYVGIKLRSIGLAEQSREVDQASEQGKQLLMEEEAWATILRAIEPAIFSGPNVGKDSGGSGN